MIFIRSRPSPCLCLLLGGVVVAAGVSAGPDGAGARSYPAYRGKRVVAKTSKAAKETAKTAPPQVHLVVVSVPKQRISIYGAGGFHKQNAVSTGMRGFPTPTGVFSVIQKNKYHRSNIYSGAPMPFMQRITWSGVAMHAGILPGYPASHGCIRLTHSFAAELWTMTKMGARVVVASEDVQPAELVHPALPAPTLTPAPAPTAEGERGRPALVPISTGSTSAKPAAEEALPKGKLLNPLERARVQRARIVAEAPALAKAAKEAGQASAAKAGEANKAIAALREAERALAAASRQHEAAAKAVEGAKDPEASERAKAAEAAAHAKLLEASQTAKDAGSTQSASTKAALDAAQTARDAERRSDEAAAAVRAGERSMEAISIFVSKKAGRVYVRQAWKPIHEAPVAFKDPEVPLGTHVYVATEAHDDGKVMRWLSVSMAASPHPEKRPRARPSDRLERQSGQLRPLPRTTAAGALERFELPEETRTLISDRLWAGASLVVSDEGLSHETGKYTDFIVLTR